MKLVSRAFTHSFDQFEAPVSWEADPFKRATNGETRTVASFRTFTRFELVHARGAPEL